MLKTKNKHSRNQFTLSQFSALLMSVAELAKGEFHHLLPVLWSFFYHYVTDCSSIKYFTDFYTQEQSDQGTSISSVSLVFFVNRYSNIEELVTRTMMEHKNNHFNIEFHQLQYNFHKSGKMSVFVRDQSLTFLLLVYLSTFTAR